MDLLYIGNEILSRYFWGLFHHEIRIFPNSKIPPFRSEHSPWEDPSTFQQIPPKPKRTLGIAVEIIHDVSDEIHLNPGGKFTYEVSPGAIQRETLVTVGIHWRFMVPFIEMHRFFTHRKQGFGKTQMIWLKVFPWCFSGIWVCCKRELLSWAGSSFTPMSMIMGGRVYHHSVWKTKKNSTCFLFLLVSTSLSQKKSSKLSMSWKLWCSDFGIF